MHNKSERFAEAMSPGRRHFAEFFFFYLLLTRVREGVNAIYVQSLPYSCRGDPKLSIDTKFTGIFHF